MEQAIEIFVRSFRRSGTKDGLYKPYTIHVSTSANGAKLLERFAQRHTKGKIKGQTDAREA